MLFVFDPILETCHPEGVGSRAIECDRLGHDLIAYDAMQLVSGLACDQLEWAALTLKVFYFAKFHGIV